MDGGPGVTYPPRPYPRHRHRHRRVPVPQYQ